MLHHQKGCINCGELRTGNEQLFVTIDNGSKMRVGVCKHCHDNVEEFDLSALQQSLYQSERQLLIAQGKPESLADQIKNMSFIRAEKA